MNRPEARSLLLKDLSASQRKAVEEISRSLLSALTELEQIKKEEGSSTGVPSGDPKVDRHRTSRIFFVSGEPGSGKSTVYLTLWETLKNPEREDHNDCPTLKKLRRNPEQSQQVRWLEPLDLEPAADSTNFLAAILVRIEQAIHGSSQEAPERSRRPGLLEPNADPRQELQRLQNDVVLAWDGNVPQRAEHVDPDSYSVEVLRAERARLSVNDRLRRTLNSLARQDELFVLPVDDFYLKPTSSLQFLRLLRMISVPRLFILVLGDLDVIEELFYQDMLGQLVRLAGERTLQAITQQERALTGRANALTAHAVRKLIPMGQRSYLETMSKLQALDFSPEQLGVRPCEALSFAGKSAGAEVTLRALLKYIGLDFQLTFPWLFQDAEKKPGHTSEQETAVPQAQKTKPFNLYDFLALRSEDEEKKGPLYTYSGLEILDLPPREVVDLWSQLAGIVRKRGGEKELLEVVIEQASEALSAQSYISWAALERFREAIQGRRYFERTFVTSVLEVTPETDPLPLPEGKGLKVSKHMSWTFRPRSKPDGKHELPEDAINYLAPRPRAWFTVLYDLMALSQGNHFDGPRLVPKPFELPWISISAGQAGEKPIWPAPEWPSFWHFDRLGFSWNKVVDRLSKKLAEETTDPEKLVDWLAYNWIRCITRILLLDGKDLTEEPPDLVKEPDWNDLVRETASLWSYDLARDWLDNLGKSTVPDRVKGRFKKL